MRRVKEGREDTDDNREEEDKDDNREENEGHT